MNNHITFHQVTDCLEASELAYRVLTLQNDVALIISQHGGRIFGPFLSPDSESIFWMNRAFADPDSFKGFLDSGDWNQGGDRIWIAPEIQYTVWDRTDFWGSCHLPAQMDPGQYAMHQPKPDQWHLSMDLTLSAHNLASGEKELHLERLIKRVEDPLRNLSDYRALMAGVIFAGYEQIVSLSESKLDDIMSEAWSLVQLNPGGELLIPATPHVEFIDYFEPVDENMQAIHRDHVRLKITGDRQYKVGYKATHVYGRMAYYYQLDGDRAYLIVRNFFNNPSVPYIEEPPHIPGCRGHSIHVYNDDGNAGGFGEMECNGQTIGGPTGRSASIDQMILWLYVGAPEKIKKLVPHLIGVEL